MQLKELAERLGAKFDPGAGEVEITGVAGLVEAGPHDVSFVANLKYAGAARTTQAGAVLVEPSFPALPVPTLRIANPYFAFARAVELFHQAPTYPPGVHPTAIIDPRAQVAEDAHLGPYVVVGTGAVIGPGSVLLAHTVIYPGARIGSHFFAHAHAVVREGCVLGDHVTLGNGVVVGSDGFGFAKNETGDWYKIPQSGITRIGDWVEIQANSCVDRASVGETTVAAGTKIDNLVQVGHGSSVGERTLLCAQVGLAGSSRVGRDVILAGQVGVAGHLTVGDGAIATAQTGIPSDVAAGETVSGYPAISNRQWLRASTAFARLPEMLRRLSRLERLLGNPEQPLHRE